MYFCNGYIAILALESPDPKIESVETLLQNVTFQSSYVTNLESNGLPSSILYWNRNIQKNLTKCVTFKLQ